jgi:ABC-type antimicrobial peptide transport system permease subunit
MAQAELVSGNYFETLHVTPFVGRFFDAAADREGGPLLAVLSHRLWQLRFGANPAIVGESVRINGRPVTIAGIAPPGFVGAMQLVAADLWLPAALYPDLAGSPSASTVPMFGVMGRLGANVTADEASAQLSSIAATLPGATDAKTPPAVIVTPAAGFGVPISVQGVVLTLSGFIYVTMALLMGVACANVAALVLARGADRTREIAVRLSLGASRMHIARQLLTESVVLSLAGCTAGTLIALWLTQALVARLTTPFQYVTYAIDVHPDARVFAYSAIATALTAVLCGIAPVR